MTRSLQSQFRFFAYCFALILVAGWPVGVLAQQSSGLDDEQRFYDPNLDAEVGKTGSYLLSIKAIPYRLYLETADLNGALEDRAQARQAGQAARWMVPDKEDDNKPFTYNVVVPEDYDPAQPAGVMVYINSSNVGRIPIGYPAVYAERNMIVIAANGSGNEVNSILRQSLAVHAVELINRRYAIDEQRVYLTGNSGGGRAASTLMYYRSDLFKGACPMAGCTALAFIPFPSYPGDNYPPGSIQGGLNKAPSRAALQQAARYGRYVIMTGEKDYNRGQCEATAEHLEKSGFAHVLLIVEPGRGHQNNTPEYVAQAIAFMDQPLVEAAVGAFEDAERDLDRGRLNEAMEQFEQIQPWLALGTEDEHQALLEQARQHLIDLEQQYTQAVATVEDAIAQSDSRAAQQALRELQRSWRDRLDDEQIDSYREQIRSIPRN